MVARKPARCSLFGRVLDARDGPVPGADVFWVDAEHAGKNSVRFTVAHRRGRTDDHGAFWAVDLPPGPGLLVPDFHGLAMIRDELRIDHATAIELPLPEGAPDPIVRFPFAPADFARVSGRVVASGGGGPLAGRRLILSDRAGGEGFRRETRTDEEGRFEFLLVPPGPSVLVLFGDREWADGASPIEPAAGEDLDLTIVSARWSNGPRFGARIRCVDEGGAPVPRARVLVQVRNVDFDEIAADEGGVARTDDLPAPALGAVAVAPGYFFASGAPVSSAEPTRIRVVFRRLAEIRLAVLDAETGQPLPQPGVHVIHPGGETGSLGGVYPAPGVAPPEEHVFAVLPGKGLVEVDFPGYRPFREEWEVPAGDLPIRREIRLSRR